jgi:lipid A 3-O-deacylase
METIMVFTKKNGKYLGALAALLCAQTGFAADRLVDAASFEAGAGAKVQMVRLGAQSDWNRSWFAANGRHLSGYWDASLAQWRGNAYRNVPGQHQNITVVGLTPVFRYQRDDNKGLYLEGGIGVHLFSQLYNNDDNQLSTAFQFGDHIGLGYVLDNKWEIGAKVQHFSNGGIKRPNSGVNWFVVKASYHF